MKPLIAVIDADGALTEALRRRFGADYEVVASPDAESGLTHLKDASDVAVVLAPLWMSPMNGIDYLVRVRDLHRGVMRILVIAVGDVSAQTDIRRSLTLNQIDFFLG